MPKQTFMNPDHERWPEFLERLGGEEGCNLTEQVPGDVASLVWDCKGGEDKTFARAILRKMGFSELATEASCAYFDDHGGRCDCEIVFNVEDHQ